jgi:hypothetical protein
MHHQRDGHSPAGADECCLSKHAVARRPLSWSGRLLSWLGSSQAHGCMCAGPRAVQHAPSRRCPHATTSRAAWKLFLAVLSLLSTLQVVRYVGIYVSETSPQQSLLTMSSSSMLLCRVNHLDAYLPRLPYVDSFLDAYLVMPAASLQWLTTLPLLLVLCLRLVLLCVAFCSSLFALLQCVLPNCMLARHAAPISLDVSLLLSGGAHLLFMLSDRSRDAEGSYLLSLLLLLCAAVPDCTRLVSCPARYVRLVFLFQVGTHFLVCVCVCVCVLCECLLTSVGRSSGLCSVVYFSSSWLLGEFSHNLLALSVRVLLVARQLSVVFCWHSFWSVLLPSARFSTDIEFDAINRVLSSLFNEKDPIWQRGAWSSSLGSLPVRYFVEHRSVAVLFWLGATVMLWRFALRRASPTSADVSSSGSSVSSYPFVASSRSRFGPPV